MLARFLAASALLYATALSAADLPQSARQILEANCVACHGAAQMSGLDLRTRAAALQGGKRGPAIVPNRPAESLLFKAVLRDGDLKMPPGKSALKPAEIEILRQWLEQGAAWSAAPTRTGEPSWWSFRAPRRPAVPASSSTNPIDAFIRAALQQRNLKPSAPASKRTLARRAYLDLHGIPPTPAELEAFINDPAPDAYERLLDRLFASPKYGEKWGRRWLDLVRYADSGGYETDILYANAWRYRDYVIQSFNEDKPYNVFVQEQIAADEIWPGDLEREGGYFIPKAKLANFNRRLGTTMFTFGPMNYEYGLHGEQYRAEWQADAVETTASAFMGLTFGCARCHDHKFDPITQKDYYRLCAIFAASEDREMPMVGRYGMFEYMRFIPFEQKAEQIKAQIQRLDLITRTRPLTAQEKDRRETLLRQLGEAALRAPKRYASANVLAHAEVVPDTHILNRGEFLQKGEKVEPGLPAALSADSTVDPSSRRKGLAQWLTDPANPLLARVMVNRIWQAHFARGLVATPNDFGRQGEAPTHPELLDWLAVEFASRNWSIKQLERLMLLSETYRQSSEPNEANSRVDANNDYYWRMNRRRLDAEEIRDSVLAVSGELNPKMGGPPIALALTRDEMEGIRQPEFWPTALDPAEQGRRSVYLFIKRSFRLPMFEVFDAPDTAQSCARRDVSTVAPQALALLNSQFTHTASQALARRVEKDPDPVLRAFREVLNRPPSESERAKAKDFLARRSLPEFCLLLLNLNEFLYVD